MIANDLRVGDGARFDYGRRIYFEFEVWDHCRYTRKKLALKYVLLGG